MGEVVDTARKDWAARTSKLGIRTLSISLKYEAGVVGMCAPNLDGATSNLVKMLNDYATKCAPDLPIVFIAGHSMGAAVITIALGKKLPVGSSPHDDSRSGGLVQVPVTTDL